MTSPLNFLAAVCILSTVALDAFGPARAAESDPAANVAAARLLMQMQDYDGAAQVFVELLKRPDYEDNDPERMRWLQGYAQALYLKGNLPEARAALNAALAILTAQGSRAHQSAVPIIGPLAVIERKLGDINHAERYCAELKDLSLRAPPAPANFVGPVEDACSGLKLKTEPLLGGAAGEWNRASQIAKQLGIQHSLHKRDLVRSAAMWVNSHLGPESAVKVSPSWEMPIERSEADTVAIFLTSKHNTRGHGAFVPMGVERAIIIEESFLKDLQPLPPNPIPGLGFRLEESHILALVILHELAHAVKRDQATYGSLACKERREMEVSADLFAAKTLRAALLGQRGVVAQVVAGRTVRVLIGLGWQYTSNRSVVELFPDSVKGDPHALRRAYCEGGPSHPPMEARMLELYRTILGSEYATMFGEDTLSQMVALFKQRAESLPSCSC